VVAVLLPRALSLLGLLALGAVAAMGAMTTSAASNPAPPPDAAAGAAIYRHGLLPDGKALHGERESGVPVDGSSAACINCHRRSGLGAEEGRGFIPPITGQFLFHERTEGVDDSNLPFVEGARINRVPFTEETVARAIRQGIGADGRPLSVLMPHYVLDDAAMTALIDFLRAMSKTHVPGVSDSTLQFATIITPDADPVKRKAMLSVLNDYFAEKNATARFVNPRMHSYRKMNFMVNRHWELHVWELKGSSQTWEAQLREHFRTEPVFAVLSGLGGTDWAPVHRFCQQAEVPCLFPNVELPEVADDDFYPLYFSRGVLLEAGLIAHEMGVIPGSTAVHRLIQVYRSGDIGAAAAKALATEPKPGALQVVSRVLKGGPATVELKAALADAGPGDAIVLWLRPKDLAALGTHPPAAAQIWLSGLMGGLESAPLPAPWRAVAHMAYPFDLPDKRRVRLDYPLGWFRIRHIPVTDLQVQADTYLACGLLSETLKIMVDTFVPEYLVEQTESMLEHRIITGYYPRLSLAPGQRFASKGGYVVHFAAATGTNLVADSGWIVP
jgi:hypothetical protein